MAPGLDRCPRCGRNAGQPYHCPYCRVPVDLVRSEVLGFACSICGRAGVPLDDPSLERSYAELPHLDRANRLRLTRLVWRGLGWAAAGLSSFMVVVTALCLLVFGVDAAIVTIGAIGVAIPLIASLFLLRRARKADVDVVEALDEARRSVALEILRARGDFDPEQLAQLMRLDANAARRVASTVVAEPAVMELLERQRWQRLESGLPDASDTASMATETDASTERLRRDR